MSNAKQILNSTTVVLVEAPLMIGEKAYKKASEINLSVGYEKSPQAFGEHAEKEIFHILSLLKGEVSFTPSLVKGKLTYLSFLDTTLKVDVSVRVGNKYLCWQIKTGLESALKHKDLEKVSFNGITYPVPGLIFINSKNLKQGWKYALLLEVSRLSGITIKEEVLAAVDKLKVLKEKGFKELPSTGIFKPQETIPLTTLGLIQVKGSKILIL